jgi:hypothetical protein
MMKHLVHYNLPAVTTVLLAVGFLHSVPARAQDDPVVESAWPSSAIQGTLDLNVEIRGSNFGRGAVVRFLANCEGVSDPKPSYCDRPAPGITVGPAKAKGSTKLTVEIDIAEDAYVGPIDIEVERYGRKGKGTTLFRVDSGTGKPTEGNGSDSGNDIKLSCVFDDALSENILPDYRNYDAATDSYPYEDAVSGVGCSTGGTSQPNLSGIALETNTSGQLERELDLMLEPCSPSEDDDRCMTPGEIADLTTALPEHMNGIFEQGSPGGDFDMENVMFELRPYWDAEIPERFSGLQAAADGHHHGGDHLQELLPAEYRMALRIWLKRPGRTDPRLMINLAGHHVPGDKFQGVSCAQAPDPDLDPDPTLAVTEDVRVTVKAKPGEGPLLYTVDTYDDPSDGNDDGYMLASICSNLPVGVCGKGKNVNNLCTFHGLVKVKLNFMAFQLP